MNIIKFDKTDETHGYLSNFAAYPIVIDGEIWKTVEHYFQARKFQDSSISLKIKSFSSAMDAAKEGKRRNNQIIPFWDDIKEDVMYKALICKFSQHPKLRKRLMQAENSELIEHTKNDSFGNDDINGVKQNILVPLLIKVKDLMNEYSKDCDLVLPPWIAFPSIDMYDLFWRMGWGEDYIDAWDQYYSRSDQQSYKETFPLIEGWETFYD